MVLCLFFLVLSLKSLQINLVLGQQLSDLKSLTQFKIAELATHAPIKHLVEVDESTIRSYSHLENYLFDCIVSSFFGKANW